MALTDSQRKSPHRPVSQRNYTSYLERSFEEGRLDEMQEWWEAGVVEKTLAGKSNEELSRGHRLMNALAEGIGYAQVPTSWWDRLVEVGGARNASQQSSGWLSHWAARPDMLEKAVGYGYSLFKPFGTYTSQNNHSIWQTLLIRATDTYGYRKPSVQEQASILEFLDKSLSPASLAKESPETLGGALDTLMWKCSFSTGDQAQRFERWCNALVEAGADCKAAFTRWCGSRYAAHEADPAWGRIGLKLAAAAQHMDYNEISGLVRNPQGLAVAMAAWDAGAPLYPSYKSSFGDSKTHWTMAQELWKQTSDRHAPVPDALAWLNAVADMGAKRDKPVPEDWMHSVLKSWGDAYPKAASFTPEHFEQWLPQCAAIVRLMQQAGDPCANVQYAFFINLANAGFDTWSAPTRQRWWEALDTALEGGMANWWGQHAQEFRVRYWWWKEVTTSPQSAQELAKDPASPWRAMTWHALIDRRVVPQASINDPAFWAEDSNWKALAANAAGGVDQLSKRLTPSASETALGKALSNEEFLLAHALLDNGSKAGLKSEGIWNSFAQGVRGLKDTQVAIDLLDKMVNKGADLDFPQSPRSAAIVSLLKNPEVDPLLVRALHAYGADFSKLGIMGLTGQSAGHQLAYSLPRAERLSDVLGEPAPAPRQRPRM